MRSIYSLKDVKSGVWMFPVECESDDAALRGLAFSLSRDGVFAFAPSDFELYRLGWFKSDVGRFVQLDTPMFIGTVADAFRIYPPISSERTDFNETTC